MPTKTTMAQLARLTALIVGAIALYFAAMPALQDSYVASILAGLAVVVLAPLVLEHVPSDRRSRSRRRRD
jgi:hypothetical protein